MKSLILKIFCFNFLWGISISVFAQNTIQVQFQDKFVQKEFNQTINSNIGGKRSLDSLLSFVKNFLLDKGYLEFSFDVDSSIVNSSIDYTIRIFEGKKYIIKSIGNIGDSLATEVLAEINSVFEGTVFNQKNINTISLYIVESFEKKGYPFSEAKFLSYKKIKESENEIFVEIIFKIKTNEAAQIKKIEIKGNKFTNRNLIIREMRISENELFSPDLSKKIVSRLNRLNIFSSISNPEFYFDESNEGILEVEVKEGNTNSFDGIIGYVPSAIPNEKGYLTGQVNVSLRNLFGTLRSFSFRWNRLNRFSQDLELKYLEPWFLGLPLNIQPTFGQFKQDTTYIQRTFSSTFEFFFSENFGLVLNLSSSSVIPQSNYFIRNINRSSSLMYGLGVIYDSRDHPVYTKSGVLFKTDFNQIVKKDYLPLELKKFFQQRANLSFSIHQLIFKNQLVYFSLNAKVINGGGISVSDLFKFGGMNSMRGYEENQFSGSRIFWSNIEYRFLTSYTDYISAFFDYGYYFRDILDEKVSKFKYGYGVGAGFQTALGLLKINFALGEGDTFSRGKIHFGVVSGF